MKNNEMEKTVENTIEKLSKLKGDETLIAELEWCLNSWRNDNNPEGLKKKSQLALDVLKKKKEQNSRSVSQKLIKDLEKIV